jgi:hypothetical protein
MSHYEKLAVVIFRVIACCAAVFGLIGVGYAIALNLVTQETVGYILYPSLVYLVVGFVLFALSKPLAALIARRL